MTDFIAVDIPEIKPGGAETGGSTTVLRGKPDLAGEDFFAEAAGLSLNRSGDDAACSTAAFAAVATSSLFCPREMVDEEAI